MTTNAQHLPFRSTVAVLAVAAVVGQGLVSQPAAASTTYTIGSQADFDAINARTYEPGDQILFVRGQSFTGNLVFRGSGTAAAPVVIGATGRRAAPHLTASGANAAMRFADVSGYRIENLDISAPAGAGIDIQVTQAATADVSNITIRQSVFHDIQNTEDHARQIQPEYTAVQNKAAIMIGTWHDDRALMTDHAIVGVEVDSCDFFDVHNGVFSAGNISHDSGVVENKPRNRDIVTRNSYFHNIINEGTVYLATTDSLMTDNSYVNVSHNTGTNVAPVWMVGSSRVVIQRSYQVDAVPSDGMMIDFDWRTDTSVYQYNYSERNGEWAYPCSVLGDHDNVIRYNISFNDFGPSYNCRNDNLGERNLQVYNNTLVNFQGWDLLTPGAQFHNNIIAFTDSSKSIVVSGGGSASPTST